MLFPCPPISPVACFGYPKGSKRCVGELVPRRSARVHSESGQPRESRTFGPSMDKSWVRWLGNAEPWEKFKNSNCHDRISRVSSFYLGPIVFNQPAVALQKEAWSRLSGVIDPGQLKHLSQIKRFLDSRWSVWQIWSLFGIWREGFSVISITCNF